MRRALSQLCKIAFVAFVPIVAVVLFMDRNISYTQSDKNVPLLPNLALLAVVATLAAVVAVAHRTRPGRPTTANQPSQNRLHDCYNTICIGVAAGVFAFHLFVYASVQIVTAWDVEMLTTTAVTPIDKWDTGWLDYYSTYPNNLFMLWILRGIHTVSSAFLGPNSYHAVFAACSAVCVSLSVYLFMRVARKLITSDAWVFAASALFVLLVGLSPWALIPYSDAFGLLFCTAILWCFACGQRRFTKWALPSLLAVVGFAIKPTVLFAYVAGVVSTVMCGEVAKRDVCKTGATIACVVCGLAIGAVGVRLCTSSLGLTLDADAQMPLSHYAMMGLNNETDGSYCYEDVEFSLSQPNVRARTEANWSEVNKRLAAYGPVGFVEHTGKKLLFIYNDGTFGWGVEGRFFGATQVSDLPHAPYVASYYLGEGILNTLFCTLQQTLWLVTLVGIPLGLIGLRRNEGNGNSKNLSLVAMLLASVFVLTLFLLLFEARARYLYLYGAYFVLLAAWGYKHLAQWIGERRLVSQQVDDLSR